MFMIRFKPHTDGGLIAVFCNKAPIDHIPCVLCPTTGATTSMWCA